MANAFGGTAPTDMARWMRQLWDGWQQVAAPSGAAPAPLPFGFPFAPFAATPGSGPDPITGEAQPFSIPGLPDWQQSLDWWTRQMHGSRGDVNDMLGRFHAQVHDWFGKMQRLAAQYSVEPGSASQIVDSWRKALGASGANPFPEMFRSLRGHGMQGLEQWMEDAAPWLDAWRTEMRQWLSMPTLGLFREHQQRWQQLAEAHLHWQQRSAEFAALLGKAGEHAFVLFENMLVEHDAPGRQITSARALFDLWIDACEESYAQIALSPEFRHAYGALVNVQMRLRRDVQAQVEEMCALFGMPTRSEVDAAHRKVAQLERQLRRLQTGASGAGTSAAERSAPGAGPTGTPSAHQTRGAAASRPSSEAVKYAPPKTPAGKPAAGKKNAAVKKATVKAIPDTPVSPSRGGGRSAKAASRSAKRSAIPATAMPVAPEPLKGGKKKRSR